mmetsp:Transcript_2659/g.2816  ORF Transcript_2659/g.2816 Transcript_2659/m.2816 type:complete len:242 (+) Transcript_2659:366-1091(+)
MGNNNDIRRTLQENKEIVDFQDEYGFTALMAAAAGGRTETVQILLAAGAKTDITDKNGITALSCAAHKGHIDVIDLLLDAGASTDIEDNEGCNVYVCAARAGYRNVVTLLLEHDTKRIAESMDRKQSSSSYSRVKKNLKRLSVHKGFKDIVRKHKSVTLHELKSRDENFSSSSCSLKTTDTPSVNSSLSTSASSSLSQTAPMTGIKRSKSAEILIGGEKQREKEATKVLSNKKDMIYVITL